MSLYDHLGSQAIETLQRILLHSLQHEPAAVVRRKTVDTVTDLSNNAMKRGHPWPALQPQVFAMSDSHNVHSHDTALCVRADRSTINKNLKTRVRKVTCHAYLVYLVPPQISWRLLV